MSALTPREIFLMEKAYKAGVWYPGLLFDWLASPYSRSVTVGESLISEAPLDTSVSDFLARTGQYVTNDASRDAAIAAAVAAEREACAAVCEAISTGLSAYRDGYGASACLEAIRARSAT